MGRFPGRCPACDGPKNSYHRVCYHCDVPDIDHYITPNGDVSKIPDMPIDKRKQWQKGLDYGFET